MQFDAAPFGLILLGLALGVRHATDPDHVIAVAAILTGERRFFSAMRIGLVWGLGHSTTVLSVGMAIIAFKLKVPSRLGLTLEFLVAIALILLGVRAAKQTLGSIAEKLRLTSRQDRMLLVHSHRHSHKQEGRFHTHRHLHVHSAPADDFLAHDHLISRATAEHFGGRSTAKSFMVGLIHGLAGSAAIALVVMAAIPSPSWAALYLAVFCAGVVIGMVLVTGAMAAPLVFAARRLTTVHRRISVAAGWLSLGFGVFLAYQIAIVDQLFGTSPSWLPH